MINAKHLIAGDWVTGESTFAGPAVAGAETQYPNATSALVETAVQAAERDFIAYAATSREDRAAFIHRIADEIDARGDAITEVGTAETGLPAARLEGERGRTVGQLRMFADLIAGGDHLESRFDEALPDRAPLPRPELRLIMRAIGPVVVFGASNFPLAFSTAGGDTAAALAAGCPVIVKGHPAHPGTGDLVAQAIDAARIACDMPAGVFSLIHDSGLAAAQELVQHEAVAAVAFTGSLGGGRALFDLCAARPTPIPFFGELGSINPLFVLDNAAQNRADELASNWVQSLVLGAGQFCTNPGVVVINDGEAADRFVAASQEAAAGIDAQTMLTQGIADAYASGVNSLCEHSATRVVHSGESSGRNAAPTVVETTVDEWLQNPELSHEVFGPAGVIVRTGSGDDALKLARDLEGQLTATLHMDDADMDAAAKLLPILERKAGRIIVNGFPTGVEVADAMVHGGPYPASTNFGATSVGSLSIRRFLRPVCYQNLPGDLMDADLAGAG